MKESREKKTRRQRKTRDRTKQRAKQRTKARKNKSIQVKHRGGGKVQDTKDFVKYFFGIENIPNLDKDKNLHKKLYHSDPLVKEEACERLVEILKDMIAKQDFSLEIARGVVRNLTKIPKKFLLKKFYTLIKKIKELNHKSMVSSRSSRSSRSSVSSSSSRSSRSSRSSGSSGSSRSSGSRRSSISSKLSSQSGGEPHWAFYMMTTFIILILAMVIYYLIKDRLGRDDRIANQAVQQRQVDQIAVQLNQAPGDQIAVQLVQATQVDQIEEGIPVIQGSLVEGV